MKMSPTKVGSRGFVFTFDDLSTPEVACPTNVYLIDGKKHIFLCDTFLGPQSMEQIIVFMKRELEEKPLVIFNSHYDYDHHWGNCAFSKYEMILSSKFCYERMAAVGEAELKLYEKWKRGNVKIVLPTKVFEKDYTFPDDGVKFFHSPGHTHDSSSCYDEVDKILFAADNVEEPIPYVRSDLEGIQTYLKTLKGYLEYDFTTLIPGHGSISDQRLLKTNLSYLANLLDENDGSLNLLLKDDHSKAIHLQNLYTIAEEYVKKSKNNLAIKFLQRTIEFANKEHLLDASIITKLEGKISNLKK